MPKAENRDLVPCPCKTCEGELVDPATASRHGKLAKRTERMTFRVAPPITQESTAESATDALSDRVIRMVLSNQNPSTQYKRGNPMWERRTAPLLHQNHVPKAPAPPPPSNDNHIDNGKKAKRSPNSTTTVMTRQLYQELHTLDQELDARIRETAQILEHNDVSAEGSIEANEEWILQKLQILRAAKPKDDVATKKLIEAATARIEKQLCDIEEWRHKTSVSQPKTDNSYNTSGC